MTSKRWSRRVVGGFYPIVDVSYAPQWSPLQLAEEILKGGVGVVQLRQKNCTEKEYEKLAQEVAYLKIHNPLKLIANHFVRAAKKVGAEGVHLGSESMTIEFARRVMGEEAIIGVSVHSVEEGVQKEKAGADYLTFGSIYRSAAKPPDHPVQGIEALKKLVQSVRIPVVAIGGITLENLPEICEAGAAGFSVISATHQSDNPAEVSRLFYERWRELVDQCLPPEIA